MDSPQVRRGVELQDYRRRSNELHSPINILPTELLSRIFFHTCLLSRDRNRQDPVDHQNFFLCSVSSLWRQIALTTPEIWDTVSLSLFRDSKKSCAAILQHHLVRAQALEVAVALDFSACTYRPYQETFISISEILLAPENVHKITTLKLLHAPFEWMHSTVPQLKSIRYLVLVGLHNEILTPVNLDLRPLTELRRLSLMRLKPVSVELSPTLRTLQLASTTSTFNIAALRQCPNLVEYHEFFVWDPPIGQIPASIFLTPLTLPNLRTMTWSINTLIRVRDRSMHNLHLPVLKTIFLRDYPIAPPALVVDFCRQLTCTSTLSSVGFIDFENKFDEEHFRALFAQSAPGIQTLQVLDHYEPHEVSQNALRALTPKLGEGPRGQLPQLRRISIELGTKVRNPELLLDMVKKRHLDEDDPDFLVELLDVNWDLWVTSLRAYLERTLSDHRIQFVRGERVGVDWDDWY